MPFRHVFWQRWLQIKFRLFQKKRHTKVSLEKVGAYRISVLPGVMNPVLFLTGKWFVEQLSAEIIPRGSSVLDMGCGTGVVGIAATEWTDEVISVDINPIAIRCAKANRAINHKLGKIEVIESDLFAALADRRFDRVLFNPPFYTGKAAPGFDQAWRSDDIAERLAADLRNHLTPYGEGLILLSSLGSPERFLSAFAAANYRVDTLIAEDIGSEVLTIYRVVDGG